MEMNVIKGGTVKPNIIFYKEEVQKKYFRSKYSFALSLNGS